MKETDIRPKEIFDEYLKLSAADAAAMLEQQTDFVDVSCPGCGTPHGDPRFVKNGFKINYCATCGTIYCSPRPSPAQLGRFYGESESSKFWAERFFPAVVDARREKLFRPKARQICQMMSERDFIPEDVCDVGAGHGLLLEEFGVLWPEARMIAIEPGKESADVCRNKGFTVIESMVEDAGGHGEVADLVTCFEVIEHVFDPSAFVGAIYHLVRKGGYCLITGLGGDGFDIQVLGEKSKSIFPPHHLNFLSVDGLRRLFESAGFADVHITTPGKLDVDIVRNTYLDQNADIPQFIKTLLGRGEAALKEFQEYLVRHNLSSHIWILAQK